MWANHGYQKRKSDRLELKLQETVSRVAGMLGMEQWSCGRQPSALRLWAMSPVFSMALSCILDLNGNLRFALSVLYPLRSLYSWNNQFITCGHNIQIPSRLPEVLMTYLCHCFYKIWHICYFWTTCGWKGILSFLCRELFNLVLSNLWNLCLFSSFF